MRSIAAEIAITRPSWTTTSPIRIHGLSVIVVSSSSSEPISPATTPVSSSPSEHPAEDLGQESLHVAGCDRRRRRRVLHPGERYRGQPDAKARNQAGRRADAARGRLRRARLRSELRRARRRPRARRLRRAHADRRPLRDRRAPDLRLRRADRVARGDGRRRLDAPDVRHARRPHAPHDGRLPPPVDLLDLRLPRAVRPALRPVRCRVRDRKSRSRIPARRDAGSRRTTWSRSTDRGDARPPRWSSTPSAGSGCSAATGYQPPDAPLSRGLEVHPFGSWDELEIWIDRDVRPGRLRLELPGARRGPDRGRLVRPPLPRQGADRAARRGPRQRGGPLPGQLDPAQAAPGDRRTGSSSSATRPATACR